MLCLVTLNHNYCNRLNVLHSMRPRVADDNDELAVSAGLSLVVLLAIEKPYMCISGHFKQIKLID